MQWYTYSTEEVDVNSGSWVLDASAHPLSCAPVGQSASETWCIKYSVTSSVRQKPFICFSVCHLPLIVLVGEGLYTLLYATHKLGIYALFFFLGHKSSDWCAN
jgi:hypothetical protein